MIFGMIFGWVVIQLTVILGALQLPMCSFVTYGHPEGSAAGGITISWNDVFK